MDTHESPAEIIRRGKASMIPTHTPGPWKVYEQGKDHDSIEHLIAIQTAERYPQTIADLRLGRIGDLPAEANAALIAAAPELLAALKEVRAYIDPGATYPTPSKRRLIANLDAAIAKAEGRS